MKSGTTSKIEDKRERDIERPVCEYAIALGFYVRKIASAYHKGLPDRLLISPAGVVFMIEFKAPGKTPTLLQELEHRTIRKHGVSVYVVDSVASGKLIVDSYCADTL